ncbi:MAG: ABC transporter ATP-binding protein [Candidatus Aenigmatarchaeota archaeon]
MIDVKNVTKSFGKLEILDKISFKVERGELVTVLGPSGCGKTTIARIIAGLLQHDDGSVYTKGRIGIMFQEPRLLPWRTVSENIILGIDLQEREIDKENVDEVLRLVDLHDFKDSYPSELSGGMKQRVALARTLITEPEVLVMDEPLSALDSMTRKTLQKKILEIHKRRRLTTLFITHSMEEAALLGDRIILFSKRPAKIKGVIKNGRNARKNIEKLMNS